MTIYEMKLWSENGTLRIERVGIRVTDHGSFYLSPDRKFAKSTINVVRYPVSTQALTVGSSYVLSTVTDNEDAGLAALLEAYNGVIRNLEREVEMARRSLEQFKKARQNKRKSKAS